MEEITFDSKYKTVKSKKTLNRNSLPKSEILAETDCVSPSKHGAKYELCNFQEDFVNRCGQLLLANPVDNKAPKCGIESFGVISIWSTNHSQTYYFGCNDATVRFMIEGSTLDAQSLLHAVRRKLSKENWTSDCSINMSGKVIKDCYGDSKKSDRYIFKVVTDLLYEEQQRIWHFVNFLQQEHRKKKGD